jgi:hypothetical protein
VCGTEIYVKKSHAARGWGKYCSKPCQFIGQRKGKFFNCDYCGKQVYRTPSEYLKSKDKRFFCNRNCHCAWENENVRCGENAPNWMAGQSVYRKILKRSKIKEKCGDCGIEDVRVLCVHHKDGNRKNNVVENLEWLCRNCHCIVHLN